MLSRAVEPASSPYLWPMTSAEVSATSFQKLALASWSAWKTSAPAPTEERPTTFTSSCHCSVHSGSCSRTRPAAQPIALAKPSTTFPVTFAAVFVAMRAAAAASRASSGTCTASGSMSSERLAADPAARMPHPAALAVPRTALASTDPTASTPWAANAASSRARHRMAQPWSALYSAKSCASVCRLKTRPQKRTIAGFAPGLCEQAELPIGAEVEEADDGGAEGEAFPAMTGRRSSGALKKTRFSAA
mmetsp:Transcript_19471/g.48696  ORF Transcript_19471/g.48696 Transcript_19471/m.48696 type:complete len:247 (-) Transcript_19471:273-1013(-)